VCVCMCVCVCDGACLCICVTSLGKNLPLRRYLPVVDGAM
jgi:hypothetical protein